MKRNNLDLFAEIFGNSYRFGGTIIETHIQN
jgi:hypothetical protein